MGGFQGGEDAFQFGDLLECFERLGVGDAVIFHAAGVFPIGVLRAYAGVIEARGDAVDVGGLAVVVLKDVGERAVEDAGLAGA